MSLFKRMKFLKLLVMNYDYFFQGNDIIDYVISRKLKGKY